MFVSDSKVLIFLIVFLFFQYCFCNEKEQSLICPEEVISPKYEYEIPKNLPSNRDPLLWGKEDLKYFQNSPYLSEFIKKHYPSDWSHPIVFSVIADEKYIHSLEIFLESLLSFHLTQNDVLIVSTSEASTRKLHEKGIRTFSYGKLSQCSDVDTRCIVSLSKYNTIIDVLNASYSILFFDLDVFFKKFPLPMHLNSSIDLYSQRDSVQINASYPLNFGCFLVKSTPTTIDLFVKMRDIYHQTRRWDQAIYNEVILKSTIIQYEVFPLKQYIPLHLFSGQKPFTKNETNSVILSHATCIEGALNKLLLGREIFHAFATPLYYHKCHPVITISVKSDYTRHQYLYLMKIAIQASQILHRHRIRLIGWDYLRGQTFGQTVNWQALYDPDQLYFHWNITLVESEYWKHFKHFHPKTLVKSIQLPLTVDYVNELKEYYSQSSNNKQIDDIILSIDEEVLSNNIDEEVLSNNIDDVKEKDDGIDGDSKVLCKYYNAPRWKCLQSCSGNHFR
eukprot:gene3856-4118_t